MTLRGLVRQVLVVAGSLRREQNTQSMVLARLLTESTEQTRLMGELLAEVRGPPPAGTVTIDVGPVSDIA